MSIKKQYLILIVSLLVLSACAKTQNAFQLPTPPADIMATPEEESQLDIMNCALTDCADDSGEVVALGLRSDWLYDYAALSERYRLQVVALQEFIRRTWQEKTPAK